MHMASGLVGVIDRSKITSSSPSSSRTSAPGLVEPSRRTIPSWSSPRPSSSGARSMPSEVTPRIVLRSRTPNGCGRCAPAGAYGTTSPAATFRAPHTTRVVSLPKSMSTSVSLSAFGCFTTSSTRAAITPRTSRPGSSTPSTSNPTSLSAATSSSVDASTGVNSRIQDSGARISASVLSEEAKIAVEERADLVDPVADHRNPLESEAEREALPFLGVVPDRLEHVRVDHPAAAELDPARVRAHAASLAIAEDAADRQLGRRFGVREEVGAEARADGFVVEQALHEHLDRAEQIGERDAAIHCQTLHLMEDRRVARPRRLVAVRAPGRDDVDRRLVRFHRADLHGRGVGPQHHLLVVAEPHVQRVLHGARRVRGRDVERLEVVPVVLDLGAFGDAISEPGEDVLELALDLRDEMQVPADAAVPACGQVETLPWGPTASPARGDRSAPALDHGGDRRLVAGHRLPGGAPVLGGERLDRLGHLRRRRPSPDVPALQLVELVDLGDSSGGARGLRLRSVEQLLRLGQVHRAARRWRAASKASTAPAIPTLSDSAGGSTGMLTCPSRFGASAPGMPDASLPSTIATGPVRSTRSKCSPPVATAARRRRPCRPSASSTFTGSSASTTGIPNTAPPDDRTTFGACGSTELPQNSTPAAPAASALRSSVPALPGSRTVTATSTSPSTLMSSRSRRVISATASTGCGVTVSPIRSSTPSFSSSIGMSRSRSRQTSGAKARSAPGPTYALSSSAPRSSAAANTRGPSTTNARSARRARGSRMRSRRRRTR